MASCDIPASSEHPPATAADFTPAQIPSEVDVVICGGGTAGSIIASRLSAAAPDLRILVLEAGPATLNDSMHTQPAMYTHHIRPDSKTARFIVCQPNPFLNGRQTILTAGQCIGGGGSINFAVYSRAAASDYDDWESVYGNPGWGSKDLTPFIKKAENYQIAPEKEMHGYGGPLNVSYGSMITNIGDEFIETGTAIDADRGRGEDGNDSRSTNTYTRWQKWINEKTGKRSDVAHHYLYPHQGNRNLVVASGVLVKRVTFEGTKATGVEYQYNPAFHGVDKPQTVHSVVVKRLVVLSGGAFGSPGILERSGVGNPDILQTLGIDCIVGLNGVGENYQDHHLICPSFRASPESDSLEAIHRGDPEVVREATTTWEKTGKGLLATNGVDSGVKFRFTAKDLEELGPAYKRRWDDYLANAEDKSAVFLMSMSTIHMSQPNNPGAKHFVLATYTTYPLSRGSVHISSATDIWANPIVHDNFLSHEEDVAPLVWGYKRLREIARRMPSYRGEIPALHPKFPEGSEAEIKEDAQPVSLTAKNISWTREDDKAIEDYVRDTASTMFHSMGTCAMKPKDQGGVTDHRLNVYGTRSLKVADMSICPSNVAANTYSTAIAIGERASIIIAEDLGIKLG